MATAPRSEFYVAPTGDDAAAGDAATTAFATIGRAIEAAGPGDTIYVLPGTYPETVTLAGALDLTVMGINGLPIVAPTGVTGPVIRCDGCRNVVISCLDIRNASGDGIVVTGSSEMVLRDLVIAGIGGDGVRVEGSTAVLIEWLEIADVAGSAISVDAASTGRVANNRASGVVSEAFVIGPEVEAERNDVLEPAGG